ncbi:hypothetical protein HanPSC8_Chr06g0243011 [Helianthus annuus]|nr:hypothetical protein HanPSC8_Chr06g0243011 [Helianthus annuus]
MRTAITHWNAKPLSRTDHNIRPEFTRWLQNSQSQQITSHDHFHPIRVRILNKLTIIQHLTLGPRILNQNSTHITRRVIEILKIRRNHL